MNCAARCGCAGSTFAATSVEQVADALEHVVLREPGELGDGRERALVEREAPLEEVEQLLVGLVERDGRSALARPDLGARYVSHRATSFAW